MSKKQSKPETLLTFDDLPRVTIIQTVNLDGKTFAWLDDDGRYLTTVDGIDRFDDVAKEWFVEWFDVRPEHQVNVLSLDNPRNGPNAKTFVVQIRRNPESCA